MIHSRFTAAVIGILIALPCAVVNPQNIQNKELNFDQPQEITELTDGDSVQKEIRDDLVLPPPPPLGEGQVADDPLLTMAVSADPETRVLAAEGLASSRSEYAVTYCIWLLSDPETRVRTAARHSLDKIDPKRLGDSVIAVLAWGDPQTVNVVSAALPGLRDSLEPSFLAGLEAVESTREERIACVYGLGRIRSTRSLDNLFRFATSDDPVLAQYCVESMLEIDEARAFKKLVELSQSPISQVRTLSYRGIARVGGPEALKIVQRAATGETERELPVRREAVRLLGYVGDESTLEVLIGFVRARTGFTRPAQDALQMMTGLQLGVDPQRWLEWYDATYGAPIEEAPPPLVPRDMRVPIPGFPADGFPFLP